MQERSHAPAASACAPPESSLTAPEPSTWVGSTLGRCGSVQAGAQVCKQEQGCSGRMWSARAPRGFDCTPGSHDLSCNEAAHGFTKHGWSEPTHKLFVLMTQQLAEETPLLLLLGPPNGLQETTPSEGHQLDHNSLLQSNRSRSARVNWRLFDLFINLSSLAECCPKSSPVAPALVLPIHTFPTSLPRSGQH